MAGSITQAFKYTIIKQFINDVQSSNSNYYVTFGRSVAWPDDMNPPAANVGIGSITYQYYDDLIFGKKVSSADVSYMARKIQWVPNTVYNQYDDQDPNLYSKNFYVINSSNRVYICLYNNNDAPSTVEPQLFNYNGDFDTADGYKWKYMYRITSAAANKFMSNDAIPVQEDALVKASAEPGAIHTILVSNSGTGYISANGTIEQVLDPYTFKIANSSGVVINGAYNLSSFYLVDASGNYNAENSIVDVYTVNSSGKFISTQTPINVQTSGTLYYRISPQVKVTLGNGFDLFAVAHVNAITTSIQNIEVIDRGYNYTFASLDIVANTNFGRNASARAIISPPGGHGANTILELGADIIGLSVQTDKADNLPEWLIYRQAGLLVNPISSSNGSLFSNTIFTQMSVVKISNVFDVLPEGEIVTGLTSGATGQVIYQTTTDLYLSFTSGNFIPTETIIGASTGFTCVIDSINIKNLVPNSGSLLYYRNFIPISRVGLTSEQVKIYFKI